MQPSPVVTLNRAVAVSKTKGAAPALAMIEPLAPQLSGYFYYFGVRGALLMQLGRHEEARIAFDEAIACAHSVAEAAHIRMQIDRLAKRDRGTGRAGSPVSRAAAKKSFERCRIGRTPFVLKGATPEIWGTSSGSAYDERPDEGAVGSTRRKPWI